MGKTFYYLLKTARPRQWVKNLAVYAALVFSGFFFFQFPFYIWRVTEVFLLFCILSSSVYIMNDILDIEADRRHPFKKKRPIAAGKLSIKKAGIFAVLGFLTVFIGSLMLSAYFFLLSLSYIGLQLLYSLKTKHIPILDVLSIAAGFLIRVYAGAVVVNLHMSVWFLLTVISASLFLAVGKRQSERTLLEGKGGTRKTLQHYSQRLLDIYTGMFANTTWLTYALYAHQRESFTASDTLFVNLTILPRTFTSQKLLMLTVPVVIYGVMRYLQLVYENNQGESPVRVLLGDKQILSAVTIWGVMVMAIIYGIS